MEYDRYFTVVQYVFILDACHTCGASSGFCPRSFRLTKHPYSWQIVVVVQSLSPVRLFVIPWTAAYPGSLSFSISWSLLRLMSIESVMPSNHLVLCRPLLFLSAIFPSISVFPNESVLHIKWPKYRSFSFSISLSNEYSGLISWKSTVDNTQNPINNRTRLNLGFLRGSVVKSLPAMQETWVWSLGWEDPLEKEMATHSSILVWGTPTDKRPGGQAQARLND